MRADDQALCCNVVYLPTPFSLYLHPTTTDNVMRVILEVLAYCKFLFFAYLF